MRHCGMDVHLRSTTVEILDDVTGEVVRFKVDTRPDKLRQRFGGEVRMRCVLEASTVSHWVADLLEELGHEVVVVDPVRTSAVAVAGGRKKTDGLDAATLAWLGSKDAVVRSYRPTPEARRRRRRLVLRHRLVRSRGDLVRTVRSTLASQGVMIAGRHTRGFAQVVRARGDVDPTPITEALRVIEALEKEIAAMDAELSRLGHADPVVRRLMTVDGVGPVVATAFRILIDDPQRFRNGREVAAYVGLTPAVYNSGDQRQRLGRITKQGDRLVRAVLVEAGQAILGRTRHPSELREWGRGLMARVGRKKAAVAVARKLCAIMWAMWRQEQDYRRCAVKRAA